MEYMKGSTYRFDRGDDHGHQFVLEIDTKSIRFIFNFQVIFHIPTKLFAQVLKDSLEEKT